MDLQTVLTALIVASCLLWSVWMFMPARWRARGLAALGRPVPVEAGGCGGCGSCGPGATAAGASQVVKIVRRPPGV